MSNTSSVEHSTPLLFSLWRSDERNALKHVQNLKLTTRLKGYYCHTQENREDHIGKYTG
jgi:hypothetical protein